MEVEGVRLALPPFVTELRPHQEQAISEVTELFKDRDVVFLDAPTGAGKTIIGEAVRQIHRSKQHGFYEQALYLCTTKGLQNQFVHDFPYGSVIKGRANYPTLDYPKSFDLKGDRRITAANCSKRGGYEKDDFPLCDTCLEFDPDTNIDGLSTHEYTSLRHCHFCHPWQYCPYEIAKTTALRSALAIANTAYFLTEANYVGRFGEDDKGKVKFPFHIIDEADTLEGVLMGFIELSLSPQYLREYEIGVPALKTKPSTWLSWATSARIQLSELLKSATDELDSYQRDPIAKGPPPAKLRRYHERVSRHLTTIINVEEALAVEPDNWVYDSSYGVVLKPVTVKSHTQKLLWRHGRKFLLMSASVISPDQMATDLGLSESGWGSVVVDSNFPVERRPVIVRSRANMTNKTKELEWPKMVRAVDEVLSHHSTERVLVHTVSYEWTNYLHKELSLGDNGRRLLIYEDSKQKEEILETYKHRPDGVLLAPSLDRGVDLPNDLCRVIVITKVPFPNLGDEQVNRRFFSTGAAGKGWYMTETIRSMVQMTGRGMRHKDDWCVSYILDAQFKTNLWRNPIARNRLPRWWTSALNWEGPKRS